LTPTVTVGLKGTAQVIKELTADAVQVEVDAGGLSAGEHSREVRVDVGQGLTVESITPRMARLRVTKS
jgi:hypothetical protein